MATKNLPVFLTASDITAWFENEPLPMVGREPRPYVYVENEPFTPTMLADRLKPNGEPMDIDTICNMTNFYDFDDFDVYTAADYH